MNAPQELRPNKRLEKDSNGRLFILVIGHFLVWSKNLFLSCAWPLHLHFLGKTAFSLGFSRFSSTKEAS